jgi:hypothetical protein
MDFGVDYWEDMIIPLDNYISKGTATFIGSTNPNYQESLFQMVEHTLSGAQCRCYSVGPAGYVRLWAVSGALLLRIQGWA